MMKFLLQYAPFFLLLLMLPDPAVSDENRAFIVTSAGSAPFSIEIADTPDAHARGLMHRTELAADHGMLFLFGGPSREIRMWMKDTALPLDMLFIKSDGTIHRIAENTIPYSTRVIFSQGPVSAVLEIPAGTAARLGVKPGDRVLHERLQE